MPGDLDGFLGLGLDNLIQILLIVSLCRGVLGYPDPLIFGTILPAAGLSLVVGNVAYAFQARRLDRADGRDDRTALPYGINTVSLFAYVFLVMLPVTATADPLAREDLAFALAVVLLGLLLMVTRQNAVSLVIGFMSLENGLVLAAAGARGMPLAVEISVAFSVLNRLQPCCNAARRPASSRLASAQCAELWKARTIWSLSLDGSGLGGPTAGVLVIGGSNFGGLSNGWRLRTSRT